MENNSNINDLIEETSGPTAEEIYSSILEDHSHINFKDIPGKKIKIDKKENNNKYLKKYTMIRNK